jgi:DNA polymerase
MSVEDVMKLLGAATSGARPPAMEREREVPREKGADDFGGDWRAALRAAESPDRAATPRGMEPSAAPGAAATPTGEATRAPEARKAPAPPAGIDAPEGISIGTGGSDLFGGPFVHLKSLDEIADVTRQCTRCPLHRTAKNAVPGVGNPNAELVLVGEAPGATEDETGMPFVGQAGQLLTKILGAINLQREDVFICNVLKHRPPDNRNPLPDEITACSPYLVRQLELIRPKVIIALGTFAAQTLLNTKLALGKLRGSVHRYYGIPLIVTYHPAALLRNPDWKRPTWDDVKLARRILDSRT